MTDLQAIPDAPALDMVPTRWVIGTREAIMADRRTHTLVYVEVATPVGALTYWLDPDDNADDVVSHFAGQVALARAANRQRELEELLRLRDHPAGLSLVQAGDRDDVRRDPIGWGYTRHDLANDMGASPGGTDEYDAPPDNPPSDIGPSGFDGTGYLDEMDAAIGHVERVDMAQGGEPPE